MRRADGSAARGVSVILLGFSSPAPSRFRVQEHRWVLDARSDEDGVAVFENLPACHATVEVCEPGFVSGTEVSLEISDGFAARVQVAEAMGRIVFLRAVTAAGRPVPGCIVRLPGRYAPLDPDGVQRLSPVTGADGVVLLPGVGPGGEFVTIVHGAQVESVLIGDSDSVDVVLRP